MYFAGGICAKVYKPEAFEVTVKVVPLVASTMLTLAPGTRAPLGSLTVPRSEVVADWPNKWVAVERIQISIHPEIDRFTADPPKLLALLCLLLALRSFHVHANGVVAALGGGKSGADESASRD